jgi:hypothetical protein
MEATKKWEYGWIILWHLMEFTSNPFEIKTVESTPSILLQYILLIHSYSTTRKENVFYFLTIIKCP